jgi:hypothetical protein
MAASQHSDSVGDRLGSEIARVNGLVIARSCSVFEAGVLMLVIETLRGL